MAFSLFLRPFVRVRRQWFKAVAVWNKLMLWMSSSCLIFALSRFVLSVFFSKSLWVIWLLSLSAKSASAVYHCFALPNEKAIWLALLVQCYCLIWVSRQFAMSLVDQIFVKRACCSLDRGEFISVFVQFMVSIRLTSFGAFVGLKFWVILVVD